MRRLVLNHRHNIIILSTLEFGSGRRLVGVLLGKYRAKGLKCKTHTQSTERFKILLLTQISILSR